MKRLVQLLLVSLSLGFVACQSPPAKGGPGVFLFPARPAFFEARDITRVADHHGACQCTSPTPVKENMWGCRSVGVVPADCQCVIYSEADLVKLIIEELESAENVVVHSVEIVNGTLLIHADRAAVKIVASFLDDIRQDCP